MATMDVRELVSFLTNFYGLEVAKKVRMEIIPAEGGNYKIILNPLEVLGLDFLRNSFKEGLLGHLGYSDYFKEVH